MDRNRHSPRALRGSKAPGPHLGLPGPRPSPRTSSPQINGHHLSHPARDTSLLWQPPPTGAPTKGLILSPPICNRCWHQPRRPSTFSLHVGPCDFTSPLPVQLSSPLAISIATYSQDPRSLPAAWGCHPQAATHTLLPQQDPQARFRIGAGGGRGLSSQASTPCDVRVRKATTGTRGRFPRVAHVAHQCRGCSSPGILMLSSEPFSSELPSPGATFVASCPKVCVLLIRR